MVFGQNPDPKKEEKGGLDYWWDNGLKLFVELSGWLVGPLVFALFLGQWLDRRYQTRPWLFLLCVGAAFLITCLGIVKETMNFIRAIEKENIKNPNDKIQMTNQNQNPKSKN